MKGFADTKELNEAFLALAPFVGVALGLTTGYLLAGWFGGISCGAISAAAFSTVACWALHLNNLNNLHLRLKSAEVRSNRCRKLVGTIAKRISSIQVELSELLSRCHTLQLQRQLAATTKTVERSQPKLVEKAQASHLSPLSTPIASDAKQTPRRFYWAIPCVVIIGIAFALYAKERSAREIATSGSYLQPPAAKKLLQPNVGQGEGAGSTLADRRYDPSYRPPVEDNYVKPHLRGSAVVQGHMRTNPDDSFWNNYSSKGNQNPYTGAVGAAKPPVVTSTLETNLGLTSHGTIIVLENGQLWRQTEFRVHSFSFSQNSEARILSDTGSYKLVIKNTAIQVELICQVGIDAEKSPVVSDFQGYLKGNLYRLANGQLWMQDDFTFEYSYQYDPKAIVFRENNRYWIYVTEMEKAVAVKPLVIP